MPVYLTRLAAKFESPTFFEAPDQLTIWELDSLDFEVAWTHNGGNVDLSANDVDVLTYVGLPDAPLLLNTTVSTEESNVVAVQVPSNTFAAGTYEVHQRVTLGLGSPNQQVKTRTFSLNVNRSIGAAIASPSAKLPTLPDVISIMNAGNTPSVSVASLFTHARGAIFASNHPKVVFNSNTNAFDFVDDTLIQPPATVYLTADNSALGGSSATVSVRFGVNRAAPSASGSLPDLTPFAGSGQQVIDVSGDFAGGGEVTSWSVVGGGANIDSNGLVTVPDPGNVASQNIIVTGTNETGSDSTGFQVSWAVNYQTTLNDLSAGGRIYHTGRTMPLSGTVEAAAVGSVIEARLVSQADPANALSAWTEIGVAASQNWSLSMTVPETDEWALVEVRVKFSIAPAARMTTEMAGGYVWAAFGQSEQDYYDQASNNPAVPPLSIPAGSKVYFNRVGNPNRIHATDSASLIPGEAGFARAIATAMPGKFVLVLMHWDAATNPLALVDDGDSGRQWSIDKALADAIRVDGVEPGFCVYHWWHSTGGHQDTWGQDICVPLFGRLWDGTDIRGSLPGYTHNVTIAGNPAVRNVDHVIADLYPNTPWVFHDFREEIPVTSMQFLSTIDGGIVNHLQRQSARELTANPAFSDLIGNPAWIHANYIYEMFSSIQSEDLVHPDGTEDGVVRAARSMGFALAASLGPNKITVPTLQIKGLTENGFTLFSPEGGINTLRGIYGEPALDPATNYWWSDAVGVHVNEFPAPQVVLNAGEMVVTSLVPLDGADVIGFGGGGNGGSLEATEDGPARLYRSTPGVEVAGQEIELMSIPPHLSFANNLPLPTRFIQPAANGSSRTASWIAPDPVSGSAFYFAGDVVLETDSTGYMLDWKEALTVQNGTFGRLIFTVKDDTGATVYSGSTVPGQEVLKAGRRSRFVVTGDLVSRAFHVFLDGHKILDATMAASSGAFAPDSLAIGTRSNRTIGGGAGRRVWNYLTFDTSYSADGSAPASPMFDLRGDAATVNAHPWRYTGDQISAADAVEPDPLN